MLLDVVAPAVGALVVLVGLRDAFLTILHPDRDGRLSYGLNRLIWRMSVARAAAAPRQRSAVLGVAGPVMVIADILLWMLIPILGYALVLWPALGTGIRVPEGMGGGFLDALYFSGVTFTTLGFGDITPVSQGWQMVTVLEALTGFLVVGTSVTYIISVFEGVDRRDARALQVYSESGGTWKGSEVVRRSLALGPEAMRARLQDWGVLVRDLHGRLYRFHGLALYVRTHGLDMGPERMLVTLCDVAVRSQVLATAPGMERLRFAADELALGLDHFARAVVRRNGARAVGDELEAAAPSAADRELVQRMWQELAAEHGLDAPATPPGQDERILGLACRLRIFLAELERLTMWSRIASPQPATPVPGH